jgi:hypothetical protein
MAPFTPLKLRRVRVTQLDECGRPVYADESPAPGDLPLHVVSNGMVSVNFEEQHEDAEEFLLRNGWGELHVNEQGNSSYKRNNYTIVFAEVDPELFSLVMKVDLLLNASGEAIGYRRSEGLNDANFALEGWAGVSGVECGESNLPYGYYIQPYSTDGKLGSVTFENGTTTFEITGFTRPGNAWGVGPYDVEDDGESPTPGFGPLSVPIGPKEHYRKFVSQAPVPVPGSNVVVAP